MTTDSSKDIEKLEADLWDAADNLRANSKLTALERRRNMDQKAKNHDGRVSSGRQIVDLAVAG